MVPHPRRVWHYNEIRYNKDYNDTITETTILDTTETITTNTSTEDSSDDSDSEDEINNSEYRIASNFHEFCGLCKVYT